MLDYRRQIRLAGLLIRFGQYFSECYVRETWGHSINDQVRDNYIVALNELLAFIFPDGHHADVWLMLVDSWKRTIPP